MIAPKEPSKNGKKNAKQPAKQPSAAAVINHRADTRMIRRAIRLGWKVKSEIRDEVVDALRKVVNESLDPKMVVAASGVFVRMYDANIAMTKMDAEAESSAANSAAVSEGQKVIVYIPNNGRDNISNVVNSPPRLEGGK